MSIARHIERIRERVDGAAARAGRRADEISVVAVSKTFPWEAILEAYQAGLRHFGENRVQEFDSKRVHLADIDATWHFIGHLQGNKARRGVQLFNRVDSVDSVALARKLDSAAAEKNGAMGKPLPVLIEVHIGEESSKAGAAAGDLPRLAENLCGLRNLNLQGLMAIPPYFDDPERARPHFQKLRELRDQLSSQIGRPLPVLSMGMSHDFEVAIEEGATEVRIGTAIFGGRQAEQ